MKSFTLSSLLLSIPLLSATAAAQAGDPNCPLLGAVFPPPVNPAKSSAVQAAVASIPKLLAQAGAAGLVDNTTTSYSIAVYTKSNNQTIFKYHYAAPGLNGSLPSGSLNDDTVYRVGSVSKLLTAYAFLIGAGDYVRLEDPITKYLPELLNAWPVSEKDPLNEASFSEITIAALMSHQAGLTRDYGFLDYAYPFSPLPTSTSALGLPTVNASATILCGLDVSGKLTPCTRAQFLSGVQLVPPTFPASDRVAYSNIGYVMVGYIAESATGKSFEQLFSDTVAKPLKLQITGFSAPVNDTNIIIPGGLTASAFTIPVGYYNPAGGAYSTLTELTTIGQSILHSSLLTPQQTRAWMKPRAFVSNPNNSIGAPWEILTTPVALSTSTSNTRSTQVYTKTGDVTVYSSLLGFSRDHDLGFTFMGAGANAGTQRDVVAKLLFDAFLPAFEQAAREEAAAKFVGTYTTGNSSITVTIDNDRPGLGISNWTSNGVDFIQSIRALLNIKDPKTSLSIRVYPTGIVSGNMMGFRATFERDPNPLAGVGMFYGCETWAMVGSYTFAGIGLDDFAFTVDGAGKATAISPRALRTTLKRA